MRKLSRKGSGFFSSRADKKLIRKGSASRIDNEVLPNDVLGKDRSGIPVMKGNLKKKSRKGRWQGRFFRSANNYFMYSSSSEMSEIRCVHDVTTFEYCEVIGRFGHFDILINQNLY